MAPELALGRCKISQGHSVVPESKTVIQIQWFSSVQSVSRVRLFVAPWTAAHQASLSITNSWSLFKFTCIKSLMPSNHLIFCRPHLLPPSIFPSIRVFSNESVFHFRFSISPSNEYSGLISFKMDSQESSPTPQFKSINFLALSFLDSRIHT